MLWSTQLIYQWKRSKERLKESLMSGSWKCYKKKETAVKTYPCNVQMCGCIFYSISNLTEQAFSLFFMRIAPWEGRELKTCLHESQLYWDHLLLNAVLLLLNLKPYATAPLLLWCFYVFLSHFTPSDGSVLLFLFLFYPHLSLSPPCVIMTFPSLIHSHFQSAPSPSYSHISVLIQIIFMPISLCMHLSNLIAFFVFISLFLIFL